MTSSSFLIIFSTLFSSVIIFSLIFTNIIEARGGRRGGKGRGKTNLQFAQVAEFSLISTHLPDNRVIKLKYKFKNFF
jgi:hypothetical protein